MNTITLALCKKPVIGIAMWLANMCGTNQALTDTYLDVGLAGSTVNQEINIPMDEKYFLILFQNRGREQRLSKYTCAIIPENEIGNTPNSTGGMTSRLAMSVDISTVKGQLVGHYELSPNCPPSIYGDSSILGLGSIDMKQGKYKINIVNINAVSLGNSSNVQVLFRGVGAGFP